MIIDYSEGISPPQAGDIKVSRKNGTIENRPVEESGNSENAKLESGQQDISKEAFTERIFSSEHSDIVLYNIKGELGNENACDDEGISGRARIDLIV